MVSQTRNARVSAARLRVQLMAAKDRRTQIAVRARTRVAPAHLRSKDVARTRVCTLDRAYDERAQVDRAAVMAQTSRHRRERPTFDRRYRLESGSEPHRCNLPPFPGAKLIVSKATRMASDDAIRVRGRRSGRTRVAFVMRTSWISSGYPALELVLRCVPHGVAPRGL
jgi:hypothetical protein